MAARRIVLHFGGVTQPLVFYHGCSREDFLLGVREVMGVAPDAPLRFRDAQGSIVLVSPSAIPDGTVLHVSVEQGAPFQGHHSQAVNRPGTVPSSDAPWCQWARHDGGWVSPDCQSFLSLSGGAYAVYTHPLPSTGQVYFRLTVNDRPCCATLGLIPAHQSSLPSGHLGKDKNFPFMTELQYAGNRRADCPVVEHMDQKGSMMALGIFVDFTTRMMVITRDECPSCEQWATRFDNIPVPAVFALQSPKHQILALIQKLPLPKRGVFTGDIARYSKLN